VLAISVLGPIELRRDGNLVDLPAGKSTEVFIRLALDTTVTVGAERLIEDLWGEDASATDRNTMQSKISMLRRALGDGAVVSGGRAGYTLEVDPGAVDALEVLRIASDAKDLLDAGDATGAVETCNRGLAMFRGDVVLCDAGDGDWLVPYRVRLEEVRAGLKEDRLAARMQLGEAREVIPELEALVALHPLRERLWALLITALYRDGRQAGALAAYQRVRDQLAEELGADPGPELQALEAQVLRHDRALHAASPTTSAVEPAPGAGNLPALSADLIGRSGDLDDVGELLTAHRLVTVVGPAGVGKTRLAIEVARGHHGSGGAWLVRLDSASTADELARVFGQALALSGATEALVVERLRGSAALLVLDNCEHIRDAVAELTSRLLDAAPRLRVLATSQIPLGLDGETVHQLEPLALTDSVALFAQRAAARRASFASDPDSAAAIEDVCRALDGLPLAIELAAARTKALSVQEIARRLDDRFALLSDPTSQRAERHRALGTALAWSYDLLFPDEQRGLWALACFPGGAPLAGAEHVATALGVPESSAVDVIARLADRSLVAVDVGPAGAVRYRLLDSVRAFALARLDEAAQADIAGRAHASWFADAADRARAEQRSPHQVRHLDLVRVDGANIEAALAWAEHHDPLLGLRIVNGFGWSSVILGEGAVAAERLRRAVDAAGQLAPDTERALAWSLIGWNEAGADVERGRGAAERAGQIADAAGDGDVITASRFALAFLLIHQGQPDTALAVLDAWRAGTGAIQSEWDVGMTGVLVGYAGLAVGDTARVRTACQEAESVLPGIGDDWLSSHVEAILGQLAQSEQRYDEAAAHLRRAAEAAHRVNLAAAEGFHLANLGRVLQLAGDQRSAVATLERAIEITIAVGLMRVVALARVRLGRVLRALGERDAAGSALAAAHDWFRSSGGGEEAALAQCLLAALDAEAGVPDAVVRLTDILEASGRTGDVEVQVLALDALAATHARSPEPNQAVAALARADALMPAAGHRLVEADRMDATRARSLLRSAGTSPI
jgi:predicted ATPase/DNA-binding SARP family transcriptional activator